MPVTYDRQAAGQRNPATIAAARIRSMFPWYSSLATGKNANQASAHVDERAAEIGAVG